MIVTQSLGAFKAAWKAEFNAQEILGPAEKAQLKLLGQFGIYVRREAKKSLKDVSKATAKRRAKFMTGTDGGVYSHPGQPPLSKTGILKRFTFSAVDATAKEVAIGPAKTNQIFFNRQGQPVTGTVPEVLEYGGQVTIFEVFKFAKWQRADLRSRRRIAGLPTRHRTATIAARPWMRAAFATVRQRMLPKLIYYCVNRAA